MIPDPNTPVETQKTIETAVLYALGMAGSNLQFEGKWELHEFPKISLTERSEYPWQLIIDPLLEPDPSDENEQPRDAFPTHRVLALDDWVLKRNGQVVFPVIPGARVPKNSLFIFEYQPYKRVDLTLTTGWPNPSIGNYVGLWNHSSHNGGQSTRLHFVIPYFDDVGAVLKAMPLYYGQGKSTGQRVLLTYDDLYKNLYAFAPEEGPIPVIRPRVYASPNYLTYLKDLGAIS
jgi:hypothetical protein